MGRKITRTDVVRLKNSLNWHNVHVERYEVRSGEDFDIPDLTLPPRDETPGVLFGRPLHFNKFLPVGTIRVLPATKFSLCGMFSEWNVVEYGPVPKKIDAGEHTVKIRRGVIDLDGDHD